MVTAITTPDVEGLVKAYHTAQFLSSDLQQAYATANSIDNRSDNAILAILLYDQLGAAIAIERRLYEVMLVKGLV